jgi:thioredoxin reductase (NADPH)
LTAGLFAARGGNTTLVIEASMPGGHLANVASVEDFPGFPEGIAGYELGPNAQEQAASAGADFALAEVTGVETSRASWTVVTGDERYQARAVVVAVGSRPLPLGLRGEEELFGRGLSHCATCDGPLFRGQTVGVVGGGDSALQEALTLTSYVASVVVLQRGSELTARSVYQQRVAEEPAIDVRLNTTVDQLHGAESLAGVTVRNLGSGVIEDLPLRGLFPYVGLTPRTAFLRDLVQLDEAGHIPTDIWLRTVRPGLFAAGDVRQHSASQAITAAGDGATAALAAERYLRAGDWPSETAFAATMLR